MKRASYVDSSGQKIDYGFESKKPILNIFFVIGTIIPLIILGFLFYKVYENSKCINVYDTFKKASLKYVKDNDLLPDYEGDSVNVSLNDLYSGKYLSSSKTDDLTCKGKVKITKYKSDFVYTLDIGSCGVCSVNKRYGKWSDEVGYYPSGKAIVDVTPYYNYYEREVNVTEWSKDYEADEISNEESEYGVKMPIEEDSGMPEVPSGSNIVEVQTEDTIMYRYKDKQWMWYDIVGNYSDFSSTQPDGFANKDESTKIYSEWSEYSLNYPEKTDYREIKQATGYKFYYEKNGKKVYANNGKYTASEDIDESKYDHHDSDSTTLYKYRDYLWRWYNGEKRHYSSYRSVKPNGFNYRDDATLRESSYSNWSSNSLVTDLNEEYRIEETKTLTKYRYVFEILSDRVLKKGIPRDEFIERFEMEPSVFAGMEEYKLEITYGFKYRKPN